MFAHLLKCGSDGEAIFLSIMYCWLQLYRVNNMFCEGKNITYYYKSQLVK